MASNNLLDTSTKSFSDIIGSGNTYSVPLYQRDYSWKKDQWEDLWNDILEISKSDDKVHYMGSIVLQDKSEKRYEVIDGQQRFTTLTLIALAIINQLNNLIKMGVDENNNTERIKLLRARFIGDRDPGSLTYSSKLNLNENNDEFFHTTLLLFNKPINPRKLKDSNRLLWDAYNFFVDKVSLRFEEENKGELIANFLNKIISERLRFIQIVVKDELNAYTVFETLNSRGIGLTVTDLLKNYLYSISTEVDLPHVRTKWNNIINIIGLDNFPQFLRHYWISKNQLIRQENLFRAIRETIKLSSDVLNLLQSLEENADLYVALATPSDALWQGNKDVKKGIKELVLFKEKQGLPVLIAAYNNFSLEDFAKILKFVCVITFRYTIIAKLHTNQKEDIYNKAAIEISKKRVTTIQQVAVLLKHLYVSDTDFKNVFTTKEINSKRGRKLVRYILYSIENFRNQTNHDFEDHTGTIEHILPENSSSNYDAFSESVLHEAYVYRLGNYTLLEEDKNRKCRDSDFEKKKAIYKTSNFDIAKIITSDFEDNHLSPKILEKRQKKMAGFASSVWRISQLDS